MNTKYQFCLLCVIAAFLVVLAGCHRSESNHSRLVLSPVVFNASNAFAEVKALNAIGPRPSGSPGAKKAAEHLLERLRSIGVDATMDEFEDDAPAGKVVFRNVIGTLPAWNNGEKSETWIILGAHYDTKTGIADNFTGANDSASGAGVLLEIARVIKTASNNLTSNFMFAFFDGEECRQNYSANDGLHGSRRLARQLQQDGRAAKARAVIILDMIGDRDLSVTIPRNSTSYLISGLFKAAAEENTRGKFALYDLEMLDDHQPFLASGMPAIDIIDFEYGSQPGKNDYWHTPEDTIDKLSPASLEIIGRTVLRLLDDLVYRGPMPAILTSDQRHVSYFVCRIRELLIAG